MGANASGQRVENIIKEILGILEDKEYVVQHGYPIDVKECRTEPRYSKARIFVDHLARPLPLYPEGLIFSDKSQNVCGSAQQKLDAAIEHEIKEVYPYPSYLIMIGNGWNSKAIEYAKGQIDNKWLLDVFTSFDALYEWCVKQPHCFSSWEWPPEEKTEQLPLLGLA